MYAEEWETEILTQHSEHHVIKKIGGNEAASSQTKQKSKIEPEEVNG